MILIIIKTFIWQYIGITSIKPKAGMWKRKLSEKPSVPQRKSASTIELDGVLVKFMTFNHNTRLIPFIWVWSCLVLNKNSISAL